MRSVHASGTVIRFAVRDCRLGSVLVASSETGICAVTLGDDPAALTADLHVRFPEDDLISDPLRLDGALTSVVRLLERPGARVDVPLDFRGTAFQRRVWRTLRMIPVGQTVTYAELARRIGRPRAVRAVAQACARNPIALAIPCHRVVRSDGSLSGYRWGVQRKAALLEGEASISPKSGGKRRRG